MPETQKKLNHEPNHRKDKPEMPPEQLTLPFMEDWVQVDPPVKEVEKDGDCH